VVRGNSIGEMFKKQDLVTIPYLWHDLAVTFFTFMVKHHSMIKLITILLCKEIKKLSE